MVDTHSPSSPAQCTVDQSSLPDELIDIIISEVRQTTAHEAFSGGAAVRLAVLMACSEVSRHWRRVTLPHLFSRISVQHTFEEFLRFLTEKPAISSCVRCLRLTGEPDDCDDDGIAVIEAQILRSLVSSLPNLDTLTLETIWIRNSATGLPPLRDLTLNQLHWPSIAAGPRRGSEARESLVNILDLFSNIHRFNVASEGGPDVYTDVSTIRVEPQIEHLAIEAKNGYVYCHFFIDLLLPTDACRNLTSLRVDAESWEDLEAIGSLLAKACSKIKSLTLDLFAFVLNVGLLGDPGMLVFPQPWEAGLENS